MHHARYFNFIALLICFHVLDLLPLQTCPDKVAETILVRILLVPSAWSILLHFYLESWSYYAVSLRMLSFGTIKPWLVSTLMVWMTSLTVSTLLPIKCQSNLLATMAIKSADAWQSLIGWKEIMWFFSLLFSYVICSYALKQKWIPGIFCLSLRTIHDPLSYCFYGGKLVPGEQIPTLQAEGDETNFFQDSMLKVSYLMSCVVFCGILHRWFTLYVLGSIPVTSENVVQNRSWSFCNV